MELSSPPGERRLISAEMVRAHTVRSISIDAVLCSVPAQGPTQQHLYAHRGGWRAQPRPPEPGGLAAIYARRYGRHDGAGGGAVQRDNGDGSQSDAKRVYPRS